jgi:hypothetical protein
MAVIMRISIVSSALLTGGIIGSLTRKIKILERNSDLYLHISEKLTNFAVAKLQTKLKE